MDSGLTEEKPKAPATLSTIFRNAFPQYLAIGMPAEDYWDGDPWLVKAYRKAYGIRIENEVRMSDRASWRMGEYIRLALASMPVTVNGWAPKGAKLREYPEKPMLDQYEEQKREEVQKEQEDNKQAMAQAMFHAFAEKMNKNIRKRLEQEKATET